MTRTIKINVKRWYWFKPLTVDVVVTENTIKIISPDTNVLSDSTIEEKYIETEQRPLVLTPKQTAIRIHNRFMFIIPMAKSKTAKQCAFFNVDEIMYSLKAGDKAEVEYWQKVKNEIVLI